MWISAVFQHIAWLNPPFPAGNLSLHLITSGRLFGAISHTGGRYGSVIIDAYCTFDICRAAFGWFVHLVDLLRRACGRFLGRNSLPRHCKHHNPSKLSGRYRVLRLLPCVLTCHNFKLLNVFAVVSTLSYEFLSLREHSQPCGLFPSFFSVFLRPLLRYW
jgi:hypothetical protein